MAGLLSVGTFEPVGLNAGSRNDAERLTNLLGGKGCGAPLPNIGAVEPALEKEVEPLEKMEGEAGLGLALGDESRDEDTLESLFNHEGRDRRVAFESAFSMLLSLRDCCSKSVTGDCRGEISTFNVRLLRSDTVRIW